MSSGMHEAVGFVAARPCRLRKGNMPHTIGVRLATPFFSPLRCRSGAHTQALHFGVYLCQRCCQKLKLGRAILTAVHGIAASLTVEAFS